MMRRYLFPCIFLFAVVMYAESAQPISEITLLDGRVLRDVTIKSLSKTGTFVRHSEGIAQVPYEKIPEPLRSELLSKRDNQPAQNTYVTSTVTRTAESAPAADSKEMITINGAIVLSKSTPPEAITDVKVQAYPLGKFMEWNDLRRRTRPSSHTELRERIVHPGPDNGVSIEEHEKYLEAEYQSWDSIPLSRYITTSDANGQFSIQIPANGKYALFARVAYAVGQGKSMRYVWAVIIDQPMLHLTKENTYSLMRD